MLLDAESKLRHDKCKFINFKQFCSNQNVICKDKKYMYNLYLHRIMIFKRKKIGVNSFTFQVFDAEVKREFGELTEFCQKHGNCFRM